MIVVLSSVVGVLFVLDVVLVVMVVRAARRLLQFDYIFESLVDDVTTNIQYLNGLLQRDLFMNSPEVVTLNNNLKLLRNRLDHLVETARTAANRDLASPNRTQRPVSV